MKIGRVHRERALGAGRAAAQNRLVSGLPFDSPTGDLIQVAVEEAVTAAIDQLEKEL